jgi:hypothetical protein
VRHVGGQREDPSEFDCSRIGEPESFQGAQLPVSPIAVLVPASPTGLPGTCGSRDRLALRHLSFQAGIG